MFVKNPFATRRNADGTAIVTADVPPARVFTVEVPDDRSKGAEGSDSDSDNSQGGNAGVIPSADSRVPHPSPPSNDSGNVGKSVTDGRTSDSSQNNISPQSADIPSSHVEADGSHINSSPKFICLCAVNSVFFSAEQIVDIFVKVICNFAKIAQRNFPLTQ